MKGQNSFKGFIKTILSFKGESKSFGFGMTRKGVHFWVNFPFKCVYLKPVLNQ